MDNTDSSPDHLQVKLVKGAHQLGLSLTDQQTHVLVQFLKLLHKWNRVYNLTAVRSIDQMVGRHILDSLSVLPWLPDIAVKAPISGSTSVTCDVLDVGTGAGLPVLPLAIVRPDLSFVSVESNGKKTRFQQQVVMELKLQNIRVEQARVEAVADRARVVVSRAFTAPDRFLSMVEKNCSSHSRVIIMLGTKERMPDQLPVGFTLCDMQEVDISQFNASRHIAICLYTPNGKFIERT